MSRRDYRCALSGVSLLDAEVGLILLQRSDEMWRPASLPLWGRYEGVGSASEINDGPNADLILGAFQRLQEAGQLTLDFEAMGVEACPVDHIETAMSLVACSQVGQSNAVRTADGALGFALLSAHVAAAAMDQEPELSPTVKLEELPARVFDAPLGRAIYAPLAHQSMKLRCKFGLTMSGLLALDQEIGRRGLEWSPAGAGIAEEDANPALWMAEAMVNFAESAPFVEALEDYSGQEPEVE